MSIGLDCGTYNLVCCKRDGENNFLHKREVNAFIEIPLDNRFVFNMMKNAGVPIIERPEAGVAYALGEAAVNIAYTMGSVELKRPMKDGCLNPKERSAQQILNIMLQSLIGEVKEDGEVLYYSVPANALNEETDAEYHGKILEAMFKAFKDKNGKTVTPYKINEALALIYAELEHKAYTGVGVSCLVPGTKIYTNKGIVDISSVCPGDEVITHRGRWRKVTNVITKNFKGIATKLQLNGYTDTTEDYKFVDNHEIYVNRNSEWMWVGCEDVVPGDVVGEPIIQGDRECYASSMTFCHRTTCSSTLTKQRVEVSPDVFRLIGYFLGDGSVNHAEGCVQWDFQNTELENISDVIDILYKNFSKNAAETIKSENCTRVKCYSIGMVNYFSRHFYNESKEKFFPWKLHQLKKSDCLNLLAGLIRSDGTIGEERVCFGNTNSILALLAKQLFSRLGVAASISYREPRPYEIEGRKGMGKKVEWNVGSGSKFIFQSIKDMIENICCENSRSSEKIFVENGFCCSRIQKIDREEYEGIVYDLQVEEDHSFSGPNLTIHNCGAGMVNIAFAIYGNPVFQFSIVNSGDWIDKMAAKATGESIAYINKEKTKLDLTVEPDTLILRAIKAQYEIMIQRTVTEIKRGLDTIENKARTDGDIDIVVSGGTASPNGFETLFESMLRQANLPIQLGKVIKPKDTLYSVARGCLLAAEASKQ